MSFLRAFGLVTALMLPSGCCMSRGQAYALSDELKTENLARAEPIMRAAAESHGAVLLPNKPEFVTLAISCELFGAKAGPPPVLPAAGRWGGPHYPCKLSGRPGQSAVRILGADGRVRTAVRILRDEPEYARLARRGNVLILLAARASRKRAGSVTVCECEGGPQVMEPGVEEEMAFILEELPVERVEEVWVPITVDFLEWTCKTTAV